MTKFRCFGFPKPPTSLPNPKPNSVCKEKDNGIIRSKRYFPPSTYVFKVESFSLLSRIMEETKKESLHSRVFESGGHKWRLVLYPNGDTERNGKDHISLYLEAAEENAISDGFSLQVEFKFFVYDHIRDDYLIIQYDKVKCYHASKTEHGFNKLLPLSEFKDASNGYLVNDVCVFGVDVGVVPFSCGGEKMSIINNPLDGKYTWNISGFSTLKHEECLSSDVFTVAGHEWKLLLYPDGTGSSKGKYVSLSLRNIGDRPRQDVYIEYNIMLKNRISGVDESATDKEWYHVNWVFFNFLALADLYDPSKGFLADDSLTVEVEITLISAFERMSRSVPKIVQEIVEAT